MCIQRSSLLAGLVSMLLGLLLGCELFDPPTGEIGMKLTVSGKPVSAIVMVFNAEGNQIQENAANELGVVYCKRLVAGEYTFKFKAVGDSMYRAVRKVTIHPASSAYLAVDLDQEKDPEGEAEASKPGKDYGEVDLPY